jgi:hypothetical protein
MGLSDPLASGELKMAFEPQREVLEGGAIAPSVETPSGTRSIELRRTKKARKKAEAPVRSELSAEGTGSATIVTSVPSANEAKDNNSLTATYLDASSKEDDAGEWADAVEHDANHGGQVVTVNKRTQKPTGGKRHALVIGNEHYKDVSDLPGAARDARGMKTHYAKSHTVDHQTDLTSTGLTSAVTGAGQAMSAGDELVVYYAGHGTEQGLVGVEARADNVSVLPLSTLSGLVGSAVSGGWHVTVINDSCHSGALQDQVKQKLVKP